MHWPLLDSYATQLKDLCLPVRPVPVAAPRWLAVNDALAVELGLDPDLLRSDEGLAVLAGTQFPPQATPVAQAYAGHQFGHFSGLLGDGRAVLLGEIIDVHSRRRDVALKGSGRTPFSRRGDGRAAIGPVLREYLLGEAMHALGLPTTRALAAVATGETVLRRGPEPGAVLTRVAASHLRIGTFELAASTGSTAQLRRLTDYARHRHYPHLGDDPLDLLTAVSTRQAELVAGWQSVGFIHGVMNTDNVAISGETIDYGPCAFLENYDENAVFSSIDDAGRYRYGAQPTITAWNLARLAEALLPIAVAHHGSPEQAVDVANERLRAFAAAYQGAWMDRFRRKLGLSTPGAAPPEPGDHALIDDLLALMHAGRADFTLTFRWLADTLSDRSRDRTRTPASAEGFDEWMQRWRSRLGAADPRAVADEMDAVNPERIPRNHLVEEALAAAVRDDLAPFEGLLAAVRDPFTGNAHPQRYAEPAPPGFSDHYVTFCGT